MVIGMKKIILVLNHVQAGMGSDEHANLEPGGKKTALGPGEILNQYFEEQGAQIVATLFCGDEYYLEHEDEVTKKFIGFAKEFKADAILCGPAMHYPKFGEMAGSLTEKYNMYKIPAVAAMSEENPATNKYKNRIPIVKMPKKGGVGLNESFKNMAKIVVEKAKDIDTSKLEHEICF